MLINLSYDIQFVNEQLENHIGGELLDFTGIAPNLQNKSKFKIQNIRELDGAEDFELDSITSYTNFIGKLCDLNLNSTPLLDYKVSGLPVYWISKISEKHDSFHWGQMVFLFLNAIKSYSSLFKDDKIEVILSDCDDALQQFIKMNSGDLINKDWRFIHEKNQVGVSTTLLRSRLFRALFSILKHSSISKNLKPTDGVRNIFIGYGEKDSEDKFIGPYVEYSKKLNSNTLYIDSNWRSIYALTTGKIQSFFSVLTLSKRIYSVFKKLNSNGEILQVAGFKVNTELLSLEIQKALLNVGVLFKYDAIGRLFKILEGETQVFYQDEFYIEGRVISAALKKLNRQDIKSFGLQHGLILRNHTVYHLHKNEIERRDGLPVPDYFVVWGHYFQELFLSNSSFRPDKVLVFGNVNHFGFKENKDSGKSVNNTIEILWPTTLYYNFLFELSVVKDYLLKMAEDDENDFRLTIRPHPVGHISTDQILDHLSFISNLVVIDNKTSLTDQIQRADVLFSTVYSTIFLDGLLFGKKVFRFVSGVALVDFGNLGLENLTDVKNPEEFETEFRNFIENRNNEEDYDDKIDQLTLDDPNKWQSLLKIGLKV